MKLPLADVVNAWMFLESPEDSELFSRRSGLFRDLTDDQLYPLYESEAYYCQRYDPQTPTRPYLVTTDIFWELIASAYEGMFILKEKQDAFPAFWRFVDAAESSLRSFHPEGMWRQVFSTLKKLRTKDGSPDPEVSLILKAGGRSLSPILLSEFNYGDLKPRGHYTADEETSNYFRAMRYLIEASILGRDLKELEELPPEVASKAIVWMRSYEGFIAPSRAPVLWQKGEFNPPSYARHPESKDRAFPLSWGFDNEVLLSMVYHEKWPPAERIEGPEGWRLLPSGLDLAAVGKPLEWDWIVPYFGRHQIVKGSVYSYYELISPMVMSDAEWRKKFPEAETTERKTGGVSQPVLQAHPDWVKPFISRMNLSCPPRAPF